VFWAKISPGYAHAIHLSCSGLMLTGTVARSLMGSAILIAENSLFRQVNPGVEGMRHAEGGAILDHRVVARQGAFWMGGEIALAAEAVPIAAAAIGMYGKAVLAKAWDDVADVTIKAGLRLLQRVFGHKKEGEALPDVLADVVAHPDDNDVIAQFRLTIRRFLETDPALAKEVAAIVAEAAPNTPVIQHVVAGRDAYVAGRDINVTQPPS
jgi:hypothetical protein